MAPRGAPTVLAAELADLEAAYHDHHRALADDIAAGWVPPSAGRARTPAEVAARVVFAGIDAGVTDRAARLAGILTGDRDALAAELAVAFAAAAAARPDRPAAGIVDLTAHLVDAAVDLTVAAPDLVARTAATRAAVLGQLRGAAVDGYRSVLTEAETQGIDVLGAALEANPPAGQVDHALGADLVDDLELAAAGIAAAPARTALEVLAAAVARARTTGPAVDASALADLLVAAVRTARTAGLTGDHGRAPLQHAHGRGRQAAARRVLARLPVIPAGPVARVAAAEALAPADAVAVYASELLDGNTCDQCSLVDGTDYPDLEAAEADYPSGVYYDCAGGIRCRGTLVYVWEAEAPPTLDEPFGRPPSAPGGGTRHPPSTPPGPPRPPPTPPTPAEALGIYDLDGRLAGWTVEEIAEGRAGVRQLRAQARTEAAASKQQFEGQLEARVPATMSRPPKLRQSSDTAGRRVYRHGVGPEAHAPGGEWDWFYNLDPLEQKRLRRDWMTEATRGEGRFGSGGSNTGPDIIAEYWDPTLDFDDAIEQWLDLTRSIDQAGAVARGRLPSTGAHSGRVSLDAVAPDTAQEIDLYELFAPDEARSISAVLNRWKQQESIDLERMLTQTTDRPAPWAMTETEFVEELEYLETTIPYMEPIGWEADFAGDDLVPIWDPVDVADRARLDEMMPVGLDPDGTLAPADLHRRFVEAARMLGLDRRPW